MKVELQQQQEEERTHPFYNNNDNGINIVIIVNGNGNHLEGQHNSGQQTQLQPLFPSDPKGKAEKDGLSSSPVPTVEFITDPEQKPDLSSLDNNDCDDEEMEEIQRLISVDDNEDEDVSKLKVNELKPLAIPIPIVRPSSITTAPTNGEKKQEIIIRSNYKSKAKVNLIRKPTPCFCTICNSAFPTQQIFQLHISSTHADRFPYKCRHCGKRFAKSEHRKKHETIHDPNRFKGEPKFACDMCDKKYHLKVSLEGHRKVEHLGYKKPNKSRNNLMIREHHASGVRNHRKPDKVDKIFQCPHCDLKYDMRSTLRRHMTAHTKERNYKCEICSQPCSSSSTLSMHIRSRHSDPSTNPRPAKPKFMNNQACVCTICNKSFKVQCQLNYHMRLHTGEKAHKCTICGKRFRISQGLAIHTRRVHAKTTDFDKEFNRFKCLICGKDNLLTFTDLRNHRTKTKSHRHVPYDSEKEKPFGCGICGKPHFLKVNAVACALFGHDPTTLSKAMFRFKCHQCPEERLGYHNCFALKRHWDVEHSGIPFPVKYRAACGMYDDDESGNDEETNPIKSRKEEVLPTVLLKKEDVKNLKENGLPSSPSLKYEYPLFVEFDLIPVEKKFYKDSIKKKEKDPFVKCESCGLVLKRYSLNRHLKLHESKKEKGGEIKKTLPYSCSTCQMSFRKETSLKLHEKKQHQAKPLYWPYYCLTCEKGFRKVSALRFHEQTQHKTSLPIGAPKRKPGRPPKKINPSKQMPLPPLSSSSKECYTSFISSFTSPTRINVKDKGAIRDLLRNRHLKVNLCRLALPETLKQVKDVKN